MFKDSVLISGECYNLFRRVIGHYEFYVNENMDCLDYQATITSANDGLHSENSMHYAYKAIDLRTKDIGINLEHDKKLFEYCVLKLGNDFRDFVFILHLYDGKNHLHIQHGRGNIISFDNAIGDNKNVFIK